MRRDFLSVLFIGFVAVQCLAQSAETNFPQNFFFTRHTFIDVGPPNDFYEILQITGQGNETHLEKILVPPAGDKCLQPPTVETKTAVLQVSVKDLFNGKDPCTISEKSARKELKRCKHCLTFSGENISLNVTCGTKKRSLRMDVLDRDLFDPSTRTPEHTSWTMEVLAKVDKALGPGVWDKPVFTTLDVPSNSIADDSKLIQKLKDGEFDNFFQSSQKLSVLYAESLSSPTPQGVQLLEVTPALHGKVDLPTYPPIAKAAHVGGEVMVSFDISEAGTVQNVSFLAVPELFRQSVRNALEKWTFAEDSRSRQGNAKFKFNLFCYGDSPGVASR